MDQSGKRVVLLLEHALRPNHFAPYLQAKAAYASYEPMQIALYQPDIPQNLGSILRLCACMEVTCHIIEPCGFIIDDKRLKRVAMDYVEHATYVRHISWEKFTLYARAESARICLL